jgi:hypothetical protein
MHTSRPILEYKETTDESQCGDIHYWTRDASGAWWLRVFFCGRHDCRDCADKRVRRNQRTVLEFLGNRPCHHLVLTIRRRSHVPLKRLLKHMGASFRKLKQRPKWRRSIAGGVWFLECTFDEENQRWGPHLHVLIEAEHPPVSWIKASWLAVTGDSWEVDCSVVLPKVESRKSAVCYASKLAYGQFANNPEALSEYFAALKGKRKAQPFGEWYGKLLLSRRRR